MPLKNVKFHKNFFFSKIAGKTFFLLINVIHPYNTLLTAKKETKSFYKKFVKFSIFEWQTGIL